MMSWFKRKPKHKCEWAVKGERAAPNSIRRALELHAEGWVKQLFLECEGCGNRDESWVYRRKKTWLRDGCLGDEYVDEVVGGPLPTLFDFGSVTTITTTSDINKVDLRL